MLPPTIVTATPPRRRKRKASVPTPPAPLTVLSVENVMGFSDSMRCDLVFDTTEADPLIDPSGVASAAKWTARYQDIAFTGVGFELMAYNTLRVYFEVPAENAGADVVNYAADPSDIADAMGRTLAAFADLPLF